VRASFRPLEGCIGNAGISRFVPGWLLSPTIEMYLLCLQGSSVVFSWCRSNGNERIVGPVPVLKVLSRWCGVHVDSGHLQAHYIDNVGMLCNTKFY
jgi:hypothetical protein